MKTVSVLLLCVIAMSSGQEKVRVVDQAPGQNFYPGSNRPNYQRPDIGPAFVEGTQPININPVVDPAFGRPTNPNYGRPPANYDPELDPAFRQPSNPNYGPASADGQQPLIINPVVDPAFGQPSNPNWNPAYDPNYATNQNGYDGPNQPPNVPYPYRPNSNPWLRGGK